MYPPLCAHLSEVRHQVSLHSGQGSGVGSAGSATATRRLAGPAASEAARCCWRAASSPSCAADCSGRRCGSGIPVLLGAVGCQLHGGIVQEHKIAHLCRVGGLLGAREWEGLVEAEEEVGAAVLPSPPNTTPPAAHLVAPRVGRLIALGREEHGRALHGHKAEVLEVLRLVRPPGLPRRVRQRQGPAHARLHPRPLPCPCRAQ